MKITQLLGVGLTLALIVYVSSIAILCTLKGATARAECPREAPSASHKERVAEVGK